MIRNGRFGCAPAITGPRRRYRVQRLLEAHRGGSDGERSTVNVVNATANESPHLMLRYRVRSGRDSR